MLIAVQLSRADLIPFTNPIASLYYCIQNIMLQGIEH